jgi:hypothetical protein
MDPSSHIHGVGSTLQATTRGQQLTPFLHGRGHFSPRVSRTALAGGYNAESLLARAELSRARGDGVGLTEAQDQVRFFVKELTTPRTMHLSEFYARSSVI